MKKLLTIVISTIMFCTCFGCVLTQPSSSSMEQSSLSSSESSSSSAEDPITEETLDYIDVSSSTLTSEQKAEVNELFYQNDLNTTSADPACIYCEDDGYFYMYGTGHSNFNCYRSKDLTSWESLTPAFKQPKDMTYSEVSSIMTQTEFNNYKNNTWLKNAYDWAPGVIYDADLDLYLMFFSARYTNTNPLKLQLTLATSKTPYGPFIQWTGRVNGQNGKAGVETITYENGQTVPAYNIGYGDVFIDFERLNGINGNYPYEGYIKAIDVEPFVDPVTGDKYIYFCRDLGDKYDVSCSMGMKMIDWFTPDYSTLTLLTKPNYEKVTDGAQYTFQDEGDVNEGQYVVYNPENQLYYLTYSCNGYFDRSYRVKQAWATSPLGPYTKISNQKGGNVIATDMEWIHRAGTGHHVFTRVGNEMFIVYHMHRNPISFYNQEYSGQRVIGVDRITWVENEDGILVMNCGGPSYDYRLKPNAVTGYKNVASKASISVNQQMSNTKLQYLTDGGIQMMIKEGINEFNANRETLEVTLNFATPITLKGVMAFNSFLVETAFDSIRYIEVDYISNGNKYRGKTGPLTFDWDKYYYNNVPKNSTTPLYIPGCSASAIFEEEIANVSRIKINFKRQTIQDGKPHVPTGLSVSDICVIGK